MIKRQNEFMIQQQQQWNKKLSDALLTISENINRISSILPRAEPVRDASNFIPESSGAGVLPGVSGPSMLDITSKLMALKERFFKQIKEQNERIDQIPGAPPVFKGIDMEELMKHPWKPSAAPLPIPKNFKMSYLAIYDGTTDPRDHVLEYVVRVHANVLTEPEIASVMLKKFAQTLANGALIWYSGLPKHSIGSFRELADAFIRAHSGARRVKKTRNIFYKPY